MKTPINRKQKPLEAFGLHLTLDGYDCCREALADLERIYTFLDQMPGQIDMTKIMPPYVVPLPDKIIGMVLIAESHISIHTFPELKRLYMDIFSCKVFNVRDAVAMAIETFKISRLDPRLFDRGLEFPREVRAVECLMRQERQGIEVGR